MQLVHWPYWITANTKQIWKTFAQRRPNVHDVGPTVYKCYTNVLCLLGWRTALGGGSDMSDGYTTVVYLYTDHQTGRAAI